MKNTLLVLLALAGAVQSKAAEFKTKLGDVAAGEVTLTCREPGGWTFALEREAGAGGVDHRCLHRHDARRLRQEGEADTGSQRDGIGSCAP